LFRRHAQSAVGIRRSSFGLVAVQHTLIKNFLTPSGVGDLDAIFINCNVRLRARSASSGIRRPQARYFIGVGIHPILHGCLVSKLLHIAQKVALFRSSLGSSGYILILRGGILRRASTALRSKNALRSGLRASNANPTQNVRDSLANAGCSAGFSLACIAASIARGVFLPCISSRSGLI